MEKCELRDYYTVRQVMEFTGLTDKNICFRARKLGIKPVINNNRAYYNLEQINLLQQNSLLYSQEKLNQKIKEHPLVTNKDFFKQEYFPEAVPDCFKDLED